MAKQEIEVAGAKRQIKITPFEHHTKYHETDQQGIIHTSNYLNWIEDARMNLMEQMGLSFKQMLDMEITSPVISHSIEYRSQVKFDETIVVDTKLVSYDGHEMEVAYRIYDKATGEDRAVAKTRHCFMNKSGIPISMKRTYPELDTKFFEFK
ncbi:acyl-CoA thioesterase [Pseudobutyrivibrio ruminis]|uniref:Acyl-CoA thioester hydrolase n=1 Tax=Pseudobutyrivibrio ruminis DSM 9787 TaxID=1123011 RepID=A0A285RQC4_9FIRM|nr:acyl-CoA thioesterase [Pseudobutyrivibrio ruminis]SOB96250.1 acyl-CoA thioester hydrolase [Pseudobutyrivibrio ruminis DSM 9787]